MHLAFKSAGLWMLLLVGVSVQAATFVVDVNYDGINPPTACEQPAGATYYVTLAAAFTATAATPGAPHFVRICPGAYAAGTFVLNNANQVGLTIQGTTGVAANINVNGGGADIFDVRLAAITIQDITINNGRFAIETNAAGTGLMVDNVVINNTSNDSIRLLAPDITLTDITVNNAGQDGIEGRAGADNAVLSNITVNGSVDECIGWQGDSVVMTTLALDACGDFGLQVSPTGGGIDVTLSGLMISNTTDDGLLLQNITAGTLSVDNVTIVDGLDRGATFSNTNNGTFNNIAVTDSTNDGIRIVNSDNNNLTDLVLTGNGDNNLEMANVNDSALSNITSTGAATDGLALNNSDNNDFSDSDFSGNGDDGISMTNRPDGNVFDNITANINADEGVTFNNTRNVTIQNSAIDGNTNDGLQLTNNSRDNIFDSNLIENNGSEGARIFNTSTNTGNAFTNNCFAQATTNAQDDETAGAGNAFDNGVLGNYYGSVPAGSGYSDTCIDADSNNICDVAFTIPGGGGSVDNITLVTCGATASAGLTVTKTVSTLNDTVNGAINPKSIPGATLQYNITVANSAAAGTATAEQTTINDNLNNEITTLQHISWEAGSMDIVAPTINGGLSQVLTDATDGDEGEFNDSPGNRVVTARCGNLAAGQSCVLTYEVTVQ